MQQADNDLKRGLVLQQPIHEIPENERPTYGKWGTPKTVVIPSDANKLRLVPKSQILKESAAKGREISPAKVDDLGLKEGDVIRYREPISDGFNIVSVNGEENMDVVRNWPSTVGIGPKRLRAGYPNEPFPVEQYDAPIPWDEDYEPVLRTITLRAPLGLGHALWVAGPGEVGKTSTLRALWRAAIKQTSVIKDLFVMACIVGERDEDYTDFNDDMYNTRPRDLSRVELYASTDDDKLYCWVQMAEVFIHRARRLAEAGYHVVAFLDSATKVVMAHSRSPTYSPEGPWIRGGITTASLDFMEKLLAVKGSYIDNNRPGGDGKDRSLTLVASVLLSPEGGESTESYFAQEKMHSLSTAKWIFNGYHLADHPKIDMVKTSSRRIARFATEAQLEEMREVHQKVWNGNERSSRWGNAHAELIKWSADHPKVAYYD